MQNRNNDWSKDWIISVTNSENATVSMFRFYGTTKETGELLAKKAVNDRISESTTKEDYIVDIDVSEPHQLQLVTHEGGYYENTAVVYTAIEFSNLDSLKKEETV